MGNIPPNLYEVLKVPRNATETDIRRSYTRLATKFHPSLNPNNQAAAENFAKIQQAYSYLSDPERRAAYDRYLTHGGIEAILEGPRLEAPVDFTPSEGLVFRHYVARNIPISTLLGGVQALAGIVLAHVNGLDSFPFNHIISQRDLELYRRAIEMGEAVGDKGNAGTVASLLAGGAIMALYQVVKTSYDMNNYYKRIKGQAKTKIATTNLRDMLGTYIPGLFKRNAAKSLDRFINSLPVISHPESPEHKAIVMRVVDIDGIIHAQYMHKGALVEKPVSFSYSVEGNEQNFSLTGDYKRVSPKPSSLVVPLSVIEKDVFAPPREGIPMGYSTHALGIRLDGEHVSLLFLYDRKTAEPIFLCSEPNVNYMPLTQEEARHSIEKAVESMYLAKTKQRIPRGYRLPLAIASSLVLASLISNYYTWRRFPNDTNSKSIEVRLLNDIDLKIPEFSLNDIALKIPEFSLNQPINEFGLDYAREVKALSGLLQSAAANPYASEAPKSPIDLLFDNSVLIGKVFTPNLRIDANRKTIMWYNSFANGTIISNQGHILTDWHIVEPQGLSDYRKIIVIDREKNVHEANLVAFSKRYDLALLKTDIRGEHRVFLADITSLQQGDPVFGGGLDLEGRVEFDRNPFRISNKDKIRLGRFTSDGYFVRNQEYPVIDSQGMILANPVVTSTFARGGYSGGPIADVEGRIIGITSMTTNSVTTDSSSATNVRRFLQLYLNEVRQNQTAK